MIVFVNDTVVICDNCRTRFVPAGCIGTTHYFGEVFTKDEVRYMLDGINNLIDTRKQMNERKHQYSYVITKPIEVSFMKEDSLAECNYISPRKIDIKTLEQFLDSLPEIMRWL